MSRRHEPTEQEISKQADSLKDLRARLRTEGEKSREITKKSQERIQQAEDIQDRSKNLIEWLRGFMAGRRRG